MPRTTPKQGLPTADPPARRAFVAHGEDTQLRCLKTTDCREVFFYPLLSIDRAMEEAGIRPITNRQTSADVLIAKATSTLRLARNMRRSPDGPVFASYMGFSEHRTLPFACWTEIIPYCFDCWPAFYERWASFFKRNRIRIAFFTARQSAQHFADVLPNMKSVWLPEATDPFDYCPTKSWYERDIDVLELGRQNRSFHEQLLDPLAKANRQHLFEKAEGEIIFPDRTSFLDGLSRSKMSICFPCSQTHPERCGLVETVTHRYFESMASKCLVAGHAPQELIDLFGYNPVIEIQEGHEVEQIESSLTDPNGFQQLVDRNYRRLLEIGTWKTRIATLLDIVRDFPFSIR